MLYGSIYVKFRKDFEFKLRLYGLWLKILIFEGFMLDFQEFSGFFEKLPTLRSRNFFLLNRFEKIYMF